MFSVSVCVSVEVLNLRLSKVPSFLSIKSYLVDTIAFYAYAFIFSAWKHQALLFLLLLLFLIRTANRRQFRRFFPVLHQNSTLQTNIAIRRNVALCGLPLLLTSTVYLKVAMSIGRWVVLMWVMILLCFVLSVKLQCLNLFMCDMYNTSKCATKWTQKNYTNLKILFFKKRIKCICK